MAVLRYIPLGGLGEVGLNMWALEYDKDVLVVDAGVMFPHDDMLGIDLVIPDATYLVSEGRRVVGIVLTHGHEDHIGGLPFITRRLLEKRGSAPPVYGTRLTLGLARHRLKEQRVLRESDLRELRIGDRIQLGPFRVETIAVAHSIPDAVALAVQTPVGTVLYTSDFKLEPDPLYGHGTDLERFRKLGDEGVLLMLGDSTNAERPGRSGSERDLAPAFRSIFEQAPGRIVVATFASNIHRIQAVVSLAAQHGRRLGVVGRSLQNAFKTATELGFLHVPDGLLVGNLEKHAGDGRLVLLTAGSQGEPLSALSRFAAGRHPAVNVRQGDWVVMSARPIPGNERLVNRTIDNLFRNGAERVFYSEVEHVHVSGHAHREELKELLLAVRPRFFIPVHGEYRQLFQHAQLARQAGLRDDQIMVVEDGRTVELTAGSIALGPESGAGYVFVDGLGIGDVEQVVLRDRKHLAEDGILVVTLAVDRERGVLAAAPELVTRGFIQPELSGEILAAGRGEALTAVQKLGLDHPDLGLLREAVHDAVSRLIWKRTKRRPMVIPVITEL